MELETFIALESLAGAHLLDAVDFDRTLVGEDGVSQVMRFRLDGVVYAVVEDPQDGYRSSMRDISTLGKAVVVKNVFPAVPVMCRYVTRNEEYGYVSDLLEMVDAGTGGVVLRAGTENTDDYYPYFVASFDPTAMSVNREAGKLGGRKIRIRRGL